MGLHFVIFLVGSFALLPFSHHSQAAQADKKLVVVSSIKPLHLLVLAVGGDKIDAKLLLSAGRSPHQMALRISDMRTLRSADLVFWLGPKFEQFLEKPLSGSSAAIALAPRRILTPKQTSTAAPPYPTDLPSGLNNASDFSVRGGLKLEGALSKGSDDWHGVRGDGHYWLNPLLALKIAEDIALALIRADPQWNHYYGANLALFRARIKTLDQRISRQVAPIRDRGFISLHGAYSFFAHRYQLNQLGALSSTGEYHRGLKHIKNLRSHFVNGRVHCLILEPNVDVKVFQGVLGGEAVNRVEIDPLARSEADSGTAYLEFMAQLTDKLVSCLSP